MKIAVTEFKAKCTKIIREVEQLRQSVEITKRGKVVALIIPPSTPSKPDPLEFLDSLHGTITFAKDWDEPMGDYDWESCQ